MSNEKRKKKKKYNFFFIYTSGLLNRYGWSYVWQIGFLLIFE